MVLIGILVGLFFLFALVGGVYMYFYAVVRDHSGKRQETSGKRKLPPIPATARRTERRLLRARNTSKATSQRLCGLNPMTDLLLSDTLSSRKILLRAEFSSWFTAIVHTLFMISRAQSRQ